MSNNQSIASTAGERRASIALDDIDLRRLGAWVNEVRPTAGADVRLSVLKGGQSNPTFRLDCAGGPYVVRSRPVGAQKWTHAIDREYRVLGALAGTTARVPAVYGYCSDVSIIGGEFYLMELINGRVIDDARLPGLAPWERRGVFFSFVQRIAEIHMVDYAAVGLADFGRPGNFVQRQLARHGDPFRQECPPGLEDIVWVADRLAELDPGDDAPALTHGDVRVGNIVLAEDRPEVVAVLDWELATISNQYADAALLSFVHFLPPNPQGTLASGEAAALGIPSVEEINAAYCDLAGLAQLPNYRFYTAFNLFRYAAVNHGVGVRARTGLGVSDDGELYGAAARPLATRARALIEEGL